MADKATIFWEVEGWTVHFKGRCVLAGESYTIASQLAAELERPGRSGAVGEVREVAEQIRAEEGS